MIRALIFILLACLSTFLRSQVPSTCFEIESILVDACALGNNCNSANDPACLCEGKNEMFTFAVGPTDLNVADMDITWANGTNSFLGVCQNATTAGHVAELNATIQNCGFLIEPIAGVLPAGRRVVMITSTDFCTDANSFAGLTDTLTIIFHCPGNYFGHFANYSTNGTLSRTLSIDFGPGCEDAVTYQKDDLVDQNGLNSAQDGATVSFTWDGIPTYLNNGCMAPVSQAVFDAGPNASICPGQNIQLSALVEAGAYTDVTWSGGLGSFSDINDVDALYIPSAADLSVFTLTLSGQGCNGAISDDLTVYNLSNELTGISASPGTSVCPGEVVTLVAEGTGSTFLWSTSLVSQSIDVTDAGTYTVSLSNSCGTQTEQIDISLEALPTVAMMNQPNEQICIGEDILLQAAGTGGDIIWSTSTIGPEITVSDAGWYFASVQNDCALVTDSVEVTVVPLPTVNISPAGAVSLCQGETVELTANGVGAFEWNTMEDETLITVDEVGTYTVVASNDCGTDTDQVEVIDGGTSPIAEVEVIGDLIICPGEIVILQGSGADELTWNGDSSAGELLVSSPGEYMLTVSNDCGMDSEVIVVQWDDLPFVSLASTDYAMCNGQIATVQAEGNPPFYWSDGGIANENTFDQSGNYYVYSESICGADTAFFTVVEEEISAEFSVSPQAGEAPLTVALVNETANAVSVSWDLGNGESAHLNEFFHLYEEEGDFQIQMMVESPLGCTSTTSIMISVGECPFSLYIPSAFSPDDDGLNDQISTHGHCIDEIEWHIYDRWGNEVFTATSLSDKWTSADSKGFAVPSGDYPYWVKVIDSNGRTHRFSGSIRVIR